MAERSSAIFWVLCPKQSLHCYTKTTNSNKTHPHPNQPTAKNRRLTCR
ncbi:MAG: hypothetical protein IM597_22160 [Pseudanabaena sp. M176S2SP2A07QC]|nr:hypothetical protein [Pseudanabaena sp. M051S1SP2A07QC]MCA6527799.1 hypothetical protein [Pseudanabaena sp. M179S2SP2A07QC]MCA6536773.1 hypothetical protein [Pseudanabaena sp. M176S2SP2A07QC]MCA6541212.1 hypothetical protein [Pseudanabaena sp. M037S2SP2A07QC]MCA6567158.1 hypothetical protein [Pseudanabaena sp. M151S2SP2A07QC]MCA6577295.1 hypothetical protein [Pseudanabaena sp. M085S1SP2A07QC]